MNQIAINAEELEMRKMRSWIVNLIPFRSLDDVYCVLFWSNAKKGPIFTINGFSFTVKYIACKKFGSKTSATVKFTQAIS